MADQAQHFIVRRSIALLARAVAMGFGCGHPVGPESGSVGGTLVVTTSTTGLDPDLDGYAVVLDDQSGRPLGGNATLRLTALESGEHQVALEGRAANCTVSGDNPRAVSVDGGATVTVTFYVTCRATTGSLTIRTITTGDGEDPDGYTVAVDGRGPGRLSSNARLTISALVPGDHQVEIGDVITNCRLDGEAARTVSVQAGENSELDLSVACVTRTLHVITSTTGRAPDADGYLVAVDTRQPEAIGMAGSLDVGGLVDGEHTVTLSGLAPFCDANPNPRTVQVSAASLPVRFDVGCAGPPRDGRILFNGLTGSEVHVFVMRPDGAARIDLTPHANGYGARWSPDRSRIVFETTRNGDNEVFVMDAGGVHQTRLAAGRSPTWSPDGSQIAFISGGHLTIMQADGSNHRQLPTGSQPDSPTWSPDGSAIAYTQLNLSQCTLVRFDLLCARDIHVLNADGTGGRQVTQAPDPLTSSYAPAWSPDGKAIAFGRTRFGAPGGDLYLISPDGSQPVQLTSTTEATETFPVWSPDGRGLAFASLGGAHDAQYDIALIARGGGTPVSLLTAPGEQVPTSWR